MNKLQTWKRIGCLFLTLAMVLTMSVTALPAYAADNNSIKVVYNPKVDLKEKTNFELYKVGEFGHDNGTAGNTVINFVPEFAACADSVNLNIKVPDDESQMAEGSDWHKSWLKAASQLENWIKTPAEGKVVPDPEWTGALSKSSEPQQVGENPLPNGNGIYLLIGDEQQIDDQYWSPVPVLIMVLNGETQFQIVSDIKMSTRPVVHKHVVTKKWQDVDYENGRPGSVKVGIFYGDTQMDTVELNDKNNWTYVWYSQNVIDRIYTSKDPEADTPGVVTEKLNESNNYTLKLPEAEASWKVDEIGPHKYGIEENAYSREVTSETNQDKTQENFTVTNTVILPAKHDPPVLKTVTGDTPGKDEVFEFSLTAISTTANLQEMPMPPGSNGQVKTLKAKAGTPEEFGWITFRVPGEYIYEIKEVNTGAEGYKYDPTVYKLVYTLSVVGDETEKKLEMKLRTYRNGEEVEIATYNFENVYTAPAPDESDGKPKTGDTTNIILPVAVLIAAVILLVIFLRRRKKGDNSEE